MDDDAFADLLRKQSSQPALPSFYPTTAQQSTSSSSEDPFANPFADDPTSNPFSVGASTPALASANGFGNPSSYDDALGNGYASRPLSQDVASSSMPTLQERQDENEARNMMEDIAVAGMIGGNGIVEVSPYVQRLVDEEPGLVGFGGGGGSDMVEGMRSATLEDSGFGGGVGGVSTGLGPASPVEAFSGGFQDDSSPYQGVQQQRPPFSQVPPSSAFPSQFDQQQQQISYNNFPAPIASQYDSGYSPHSSQNMTTYQEAFPSSPGFPPPFASSSSSSPVKTNRSAMPASLLAPPEDMLGTTPSDSLKAAFVKKTSTGPSTTTSTSTPLGPSAGPAVPSSSGLGSSIPRTASPVASDTGEKKPYVFKPGGSIKKRKGEGLRQGTHSRTPSALAAPASSTATAVPVAAAPPPVPEKDSPTTQKVTENEVDASKVNGENKETVAEEKKEDLAEPASQAVPAQLAEKILGAENPQEASKIVAEQIAPAVMKSSDHGPGASESEGGKQHTKTDYATLSVAKDIPLPESEVGTPRPGTPVPMPTDEPINNASTASETAGISASDPQTTSAPAATDAETPPQTSQIDRVAVSPLSPQTVNSTPNHFRALSIGASSSSMLSAEPHSSDVNLNAEQNSATTSGRQTSWGRAYDEPPSPQVPQSAQAQQEPPSPAMQGWTTEIPRADLGQSEALALPTNGSGGGWGSPGYATEPLGGMGGEDATAEAWGGESRLPEPVMQEQQQQHLSPTRSLLARSSSNVSIKEGSTRNRLLAQPMFTITLSDPTKVGDPIRGHIVYTVTTRTTSPHYRRAECSVLRRFSDFLWLFEAVSANNPGVIVPAVPDKHPFGRFEEQFVETRRSALESCVTKMANHPVLALDQDLRLFLESDSFALEIKHRRQEMTQEKAGLLSGLTGPKFSETDEWFDNKKAFLDALEVQLKALTKSIEASSKHRLELAVLIDRLADSTGLVAESDLAVDLSAVLQRLSSLQKKEKDMLETQAKMDVVHLMNCAEEYIRTIGSVRLAFASRIKSYFTWQSVEAESRRLRQQHEKLRKAGKIAHERIQPALAEIADADRRAVDAHSDFDAVTRLVKIEFGRFETERVLDFKNMLEKYLEGMVERQREFISAWEGYHAILLRMAQSNQAKSNSVNGSS